MDFISVSSKRFGGKYGQSDYLQLWYTNSAKESHYIVYMLQKYQDSNDYYLAKYATLNRHQEVQTCICVMNYSFHMLKIFKSS